MYCLQPTTHTIASKSLKLSQLSSSDHFIQFKHSLKIKPIPIICQKIQQKGKDDWRVIPRITVKGYKYLSRVGTTGESTIGILNKMKKSTNLRFIRNLEFDPYFCEDSGLKSLSGVFRKLKKNVSSLILIIRRFVKEDNLEEFCASMGRLKNLVKLKVELTSIEGLDSKQVSLICQACTKCSFLKSFDLNIFGVPSDHKRDFHMSKYMPWLEHYGQSFQSSQTLDRRFIGSDNLKKVRKLKNFKSCSLKVSFKASWSSYFDGVNAKKNISFMRAIQDAMNPTYLTFIFENFPLSSTLLNGLANALPKITNLRFLHLELANIKLSEFDLMLFANSFLNAGQIEHLTFKYIDKSLIPITDVFQFILILIKYAKFPKFDLFFRKILYEEWDSPEIANQFEKFENIKYIMTKQSIHIQKLRGLDICE